MMATAGVLFDAPVSAVGNIVVQSGGSVNIGSTLTSGGKILVNSQGSTGLVIGSDGGVFSTAAANGEIVLVGATGFFNFAGDTAVAVSSGRYLLYVPSYDSQSTSLGGLTGLSLYNHVYDGPEFIAGSSNRIIYAQAAFASITGDSFSRQYGQANPLFSGTISGLINGDTISDFGPVTYTTSANTSSNVGSYLITAQALNSLNYSLAYEPGTLDVNPAPLTIRANNFSRPVNQSNPNFTASFQGLRLGDQGSVVQGLGFSTTALPDSPTGNYVIDVFGGQAQNYTLAYVAGNLNVTGSLIGGSGGGLPN